MRVLVKDNGLFVCVAERLAREADEVFYYSECRGGGSPLPGPSHIGYGVPGIVRVGSYVDAGREADLIVFPDAGDGDVQEDYRRQGKRVFGTGRGEVLELDRVFFRKVLGKLGLPVSPYTVVKGIDALRLELKKVKDKYVKISQYRGIAETFHHKNYKFSESEIDRIAHVCGCLDKEVVFIVEDPIDSVIEVGAEWHFTDTGFLPRGMWGYEVKNKGYCGKVCSYLDLPRPLKVVMDKFAPVFKKYRVRGALSTEVRVTKKREPYFIDPCQRFASPPGGCLSEVYANMLPVMQSVAEGKSAVPREIARYWAEIMLKVEQVPSSSMAIDFPDKIARNVKLRYLCRIQNQYYYLPQAGETIIGSAIGWGNSIKAAQDMALDAAGQVDAGDLYYDKDVFEQADEQIEKGKSVGMGVF